MAKTMMTATDIALCVLQKQMHPNPKIIFHTPLKLVMLFDWGILFTRIRYGKRSDGGDTI